MTTFGNTELCKHKVVAKVCPYCEIETLRTQRDELHRELEHYRGLAMVKGADKALQDYEELKQQRDELVEALTAVRYESVCWHTHFSKTTQEKITTALTKIKEAGE